MKAVYLSCRSLLYMVVAFLLLGPATSQATESCPQWPRSTEGQRHAQQAQKDSAAASAGYERCKAQGAASIPRLACDAEVYRGYLVIRERSQAAEQAALASFRQQPGNCVARAAPIVAPKPVIQAPPPVAAPEPSSGFVIEPEVVVPKQGGAEAVPEVVPAPVAEPAPVVRAEPTAAPPPSEPVAVAAAAAPSPASPAELPPMPAPERFKNCRVVPPILEAYSPYGGSFSARAETAMFTIDAALRQLDSQCLFLVDYRDLRRELGDARTRFEQVCNAARVDGKRCEARRHN